METEKPNVNAGNNNVPFAMRIAEAGLGKDVEEAAELLLSEGPGDEPTLNARLAERKKSDPRLSGVTRLGVLPMAENDAAVLVFHEQKTWPFFFSGPSYASDHGIKIIYLADGFSERSIKILQDREIYRLQQGISTSTPSKLIFDLIGSALLAVLTDPVGGVRFIAELIPVQITFFGSLWNRFNRQSKTFDKIEADTRG